MHIADLSSWLILVFLAPIALGQASDGPIQGERFELDALRSSLAADQVVALEAHVEAGELAEARLLLWGIWAQAKRDRYWANKRTRPQTRKRKERLLAIETLYARARDACYGSFPSLADDDDLVVLQSQIAAAQIGLQSGDLGTAYSVIGHIKARRTAGLVVPQELLATAQALVEAYRERNGAANDALRGEGSALVAANLLRGKKDLEQRMYVLFDLQQRLDEVDGSLLGLDRQGQRVLQDLATSYEGLAADIEGARAALVAFAAVAPDPEWIDSAFAGFIAKDPQQKSTWASFLAVARAGSLGAAVLAELGLPARIGNVYLDYADGCLKKAELEYQRDRFEAGAAQLAEAEAGGLANARRFGADEAQLAAREAAIENLVAAAGESKRARARTCLASATAALDASLEDPHQLARAVEWLASAQGWLDSALKDGAGADDLEPGLARAQARLTEARVQLADQQLGRAAEDSDQAREALASGGDAWRVPAILDRAADHLEAAASYLAQVDSEVGGAVATRIVEARTAHAALREQVVSSQTLPADAYQGTQGPSWRRDFSDLLQSERGWQVLGLSIAGAQWQDKTAEYEYWSGSNTKTIETRWYRHLFVWAAIARPDAPELVDLRYLGFRLHKMTDGSYAKLKLFWVEEPLPMLRRNLSGR